MAKKTFAPRSNKGKLLPEVGYTTLVYIVGTVVHNLALHHSLGEPKGRWQVSDPATGIHVCEVIGQYKGCPVSSASLSQKDAMTFANATLDALLNRIGSAEFNQAVANSHKKWCKSSAALSIV